MDGAPLGAYDPSFAKMKEFLEVCGIAYDYKGLGGHAKPYYLNARRIVYLIYYKILNKAPI